MAPKRKAESAASPANDDAAPRRSGRAKTNAVNYNEDGEQGAQGNNAEPTNIAKKPRSSKQPPPKADDGDDNAPGDNEGQDSDAKVKPGDQIPLDIPVLTSEDKKLTLGDLVADKSIALFIYPKGVLSIVKRVLAVCDACNALANTPGCVKQAEGFKREYQSFTEAGYEVYGLSMDSPKVLANWKTKSEFPYHFLSDPEQKLIKALGGSKSAKSVNRSHFVIEKGGKLLLANWGVKPPTSAQEVLKFIQDSK